MMAELKPDVPVVQAEPTLSVEPGALGHLPVGRHRLKLVVVDDAGVESEPAFFTVKVVSPGKPTAVLELVDEDGKPIEPNVAAGRPFFLSGADSHEGGGEIVSWRFTFVGEA